MLGIALGKLQRWPIPLGQIHTAQMRPEHVDLAADEPVAVCQATEQPPTQQLGSRWVSLASTNQARRPKRVQDLDQCFPEKQDHNDGKAPRHIPPETAKRLLK